MHYRFITAARRIIYGILFITVYHSLQVFPQSTWQKAFGGSGADDAKSTWQTADSCFIVAGMTESYGSGGEDVYLLKINRDGDTLWARTFGGLGDECAYAVRQTFDGGYILTGYTTSYGLGAYDIWLIKTDGGGDTVWTRTYGSNYIEWALSVEQTSDSGYVIAGFTDHIETDALLIRTNAMGDTLWTKSFGGDGDDWTGSVKQTNDNGFILTGFTSSNGSRDLWLLKTDATGGLSWSVTYGGEADDWGRAVELIPEGGYIVGGATESFGSGGSDVWILRTGPQGDSIWAKCYGGSADDWAYASIIRTLDERYVVAGSTSSAGAGASDAFLVKVNADGDTMWTRTYGGMEDDHGSAVVETMDGGFIIAGNTSSFGAGSNDVYLLKTDSAGNVQIFTGIETVNVLPEKNSIFNIFPIPCKNKATFYFDLTEISLVSIEVTDMNGRLIIQLVHKTLPEGPFAIEWDIGSRKNIRLPGVYVCLLKLNNKIRAAKKFVILQ